MRKWRLRSATRRAVLLFLCTAALVVITSCKKQEAPGKDGKKEAKVVVVYAAHDKVFSQPIIKKFEEKTGIEVRAKYDTEATKTVGLVNAIREEAKTGRVRCDVFWNNEPMHTIRLKKEGVLQPYESPEAKAYPKHFRDPDNMWTGFAGRARVLIVNTELVPTDKRPDSIFDLTKPEWKGKVGIAKPLFGTTVTHVACLWAKLGPEKTTQFFNDLKANDVTVCASNRDSARQVGQGALHIGFTDNDDYLAEKSGGAPVEIIYPDSGQDQIGTLFLPNTVAIIKDAPHPEAARKFVDFLISEEIECMLAKSGSGQVPLRKDAGCKSEIKGPRELNTMQVDMDKAAATFDEAMKYVEENFLQ